MSRLEDEAKPWLLSMIKGHGRTYHDKGKRLVAQWTVKTALVSGSAFQVRTPAHFYEHFYESQMPLEFPRFCGHLMAVPTGRPERMSVDAIDPAVSVGVPSGGGPVAQVERPFDPAAGQGAWMLAAVAA